MDAGALLDLLGNENRRRILRLLSQKPCYVTEISEHLGVSPKAVIDHLRRLEDAGLVESHTDDQRRKYFRIAQHLRLEVTLAPHGFGMKSAYPASPSLDLSSCQHLSIDLSRERLRRSIEGTGGFARGHDGGRPDRDTITELADQLEELEAIERELSLAQRWVQGRIAATLDKLAEVVEDGEDAYLDAEVLAALGEGAHRPEEISRTIDVPPGVVEERLRRLADHGLVRRSGEAWALA